MKCRFRIALAISLFSAVAGCGKLRCSKADHEDSMPVGGAGDQNRPVRPAFFGDGSARCSGKGLVAQGFSGAMDENTSIDYLGKIRAGPIDYSIYYFSHVDNHGSYRILITENGCSYFGSYSVNERPIGVSGSDIVFDAPEKLGRVIRFTGISPPARVVVNGHLTHFAL